MAAGRGLSAYSGDNSGEPHAHVSLFCFPKKKSQIVTWLLQILLLLLLLLQVLCCLAVESRINQSCHFICVYSRSTSTIGCDDLQVQCSEQCSTVQYSMTWYGLATLQPSVPWNGKERSGVECGGSPSRSHPPYDTCLLQRTGMVPAWYEVWYDVVNRSLILFYVFRLCAILFYSILFYSIL